MLLLLPYKLKPILISERTDSQHECVGIRHVTCEAISSFKTCSPHASFEYKADRITYGPVTADPATPSKCLSSRLLSNDEDASLLAATATGVVPATTDGGGAGNESKFLFVSGF